MFEMKLPKNVEKVEKNVGKDCKKKSFFEQLGDIENLLLSEESLINVATGEVKSYTLNQVENIIGINKKTV